MTDDLVSAYTRSFDGARVAIRLHTGEAGSSADWRIIDANLYVTFYLIGAVVIWAIAQSAIR